MRDGEKGRGRTKRDVMSFMLRGQEERQRWKHKGLLEYVYSCVCFQLRVCLCDARFFTFFHVKRDSKITYVFVCMKTFFFLFFFCQSVHERIGKKGELNTQRR